MSLELNIASRLGKVEEYYFSTKLKEIAQMRAGGKDIINLGIGSPDLPPSKMVIEKLSQTAMRPENHAYQSYQGIPKLRKAFADFYKDQYGVEMDFTSEILPLIGSKEGIMHIAMAYLEAGDETLVPNPGYPTYAAACKLTGADIVEYELLEERGWMPDLKALEERDLSKVKIMWVNYPNMPTGAKGDSSFFIELRDFAIRNNILIVNDNPYSFILNKNPLSILSIPGMKEVALELNSLSKSHNMAGWRIGAVFGLKNYLEPVLRFKSNMDSGMFLPLQEAAALALEQGKEWFEELNVEYEKRQSIVFELLDLIGATYDPKQTGMFVWAKKGKNFESGYQVSDKYLYEYGIFITPGGIFGTQGKDYIRVSLCSKETVFQQAINRIKQDEKI
ncbi:MAG: LL-diaminopimelate aminotransferase [Bacteroidota bacterium]|jgi:aspartate/methionine/tyrosine aminotransferase